MNRYQAINERVDGKNHKRINPQVLEDMHPNWLSVARRMQSVAKSRGAQLITITVVVNADGVPSFWLNPKVRQIEPASTAEEFLATLLGMERKGDIIDTL